MVINDETFASGNPGEIKIWSIKDYSKTELIFSCIKSINAHEESMHGISLHLLGNDLMVSESGEDEFIIWDVKKYKCIKTYKEDSYIKRLIVTKNCDIITATYDNKVNLWKI
jgi:WD40 repeat protein